MREQFLSSLQSERILAGKRQIRKDTEAMQARHNAEKKETAEYRSHSGRKTKKEEEEETGRKGGINPASDLTTEIKSPKGYAETSFMSADELDELNRTKSKSGFVPIEEVAEASSNPEETLLAKEKNIRKARGIAKEHALEKSEKVDYDFDNEEPTWQSHAEKEEHGYWRKYKKTGEEKNDVESGYIESGKQAAYEKKRSNRIDIEGRIQRSPHTKLILNAKGESVPLGIKGNRPADKPRYKDVNRESVRYSDIDKEILKGKLIDFIKKFGEKRLFRLLHSNNDAAWTYVVCRRDFERMPNFKDLIKIAEETLIEQLEKDWHVATFFDANQDDFEMDRFDEALFAAQKTINRPFAA